MASEVKSHSLYRSRRVKNGLSNVVLPFDVLHFIIETLVKSGLEAHELIQILCVCKEFRRIGEKFAYESISMEKSDFFFRCPNGIREVEERNRKFHRSLLTTLKNRPDLASRVNYLSVWTNPMLADCGLSDIQFQIIRRCASLNELRLCLQWRYKAGKRIEKLGSIIRKGNPTIITLYTDDRCPGRRPGGGLRSGWDLLDMFSLLRGCSKLRHLVVHPEQYRSLQPQNIPDDLELPIESLYIEVNRHNHQARGLLTPNSICLAKLKLPNLKAFKAAMLADNPEDRETFRRCLTENWVETLSELDLTTSIMDHSRVDTRYDIFGVPNTKVPRLRKMRISARILRPQTLLMMSTLEKVWYSNASIEDLDALASALESRNNLLPALRSFMLDELMPWPGVAKTMADRIYAVFLKRNIKFSVRTLSVPSRLPPPPPIQIMV